jgi:hypothetical protein
MRAHSFGWQRLVGRSFPPVRGNSRGQLFHHQRVRRRFVIILGLILLLLGLFLHIGTLWTIGIIVLVVGVVLALLGSTGRAVGGRRHYF